MYNEGDKAEQQIKELKTLILKIEKICKNNPIYEKTKYTKNSYGVKTNMAFIEIRNLINGAKDNELL